jgi:hypothetical protein
LRRIRAADQAGKNRRADCLTREYLSSLDARLVAVEKSVRRLPKRERPSDKERLEIARGLNAWRGTEEKVLVHAKLKPGTDSDFRIVQEFGIENHALQSLVVAVLKARSNLHPCQYLMRGTHKAIQQVATHLANGYVWAIESDIASCYPSFDRGKVEDHLPLPKDVTRSVLLCVASPLSIGHHPLGPADDPSEDQLLLSTDLFADAQRGFPLGSASSPFAVEVLLAPAYHQLPEGAVAVGYADNFLAMGKDKSDAVSTTSSFWSALKAHPAGHLRPKLPRIFKPGEPIDFLGHRLELLKGVVQIDPTPENLGLFRAQLQRDLRAIRRSEPNSVRRKKLTQHLRRFVRSWTGAFKLCANVGMYRADALKKIDAAAGELNG